MEITKIWTAVIKVLRITAFPREEILQRMTKSNEWNIIRPLRSITLLPRGFGADARRLRRVLTARELKKSQRTPLKAKTNILEYP